jgi:diketogulonate reductase-like aldo/keto reductase
VQYHIGMSNDPSGIASYCRSKNVTLQAYSPLGDGTTELINGPLVSGIGHAHNKSGAQVSLHWVYKQGPHHVSITRHPSPLTRR